MGNLNKYPYINEEDDRYRESLQWYKVFNQDIQLMRAAEYDLNEINRIFKTAIHDWNDREKIHAKQIWEARQEQLKAMPVITSVFHDEGIPNPPESEVSA